MTFLLKVIVTAFAVVIGSYFLPWAHVANFTTAIVVAFVLGILNAILKPILVLLTLPVTILSMGLFLLVINAFIIMLTDYFIAGFSAGGFWGALIFSIVLSVLNSLLSLPVRESRGRY
jgi:putative membrane protein